MRQSSPSPLPGQGPELASGPAEASAGQPDRQPDSRTPEERSMAARIAIYTRWGKEDPVEGTRKAREAEASRYEKLADPDGVLLPSERRRRAEALRQAHMVRMALASKKARARKKAAASNGRRPPPGYSDNDETRTTDRSGSRTAPLSSTDDTPDEEGGHRG